MSNTRRVSNGREGALLALTSALVLSSCTDVVSLGSWTQQQPAIMPTPSSSPSVVPPPAVTPDAAVPPLASTPPVQSAPVETSNPPPPMIDAGPVVLIDAGNGLDASIADPADAGDAGDAYGMPACNALGTPGDRSPLGAQFAPTETSTDWTWSSAADSIQWDLMIEQEVEQPTPTSPGYYWAQQFSFVQGVTGIIGLQAGGKYQSDPPTSESEWTKMAVFWLSGPPIDAELGDIAYPDARIYDQPAVGLNWTTIHAKFEWEACHVYQMRFAPDKTEAGGATWYGAWITDRTTAQATLLGRMLLPPDAGQISLYSISRTSPILKDAMTCEASPRASAVFGRPTAADGSHSHARRGHRFTTPSGCRRSRFVDFEDAARHELSIE